MSVFADVSFSDVTPACVGGLDHDLSRAVRRWSRPTLLLRVLRAHNPDLECVVYRVVSVEIEESGLI